MDFWDQYSFALREAQKKRRWMLPEGLEIPLLQAPPFAGCEDGYIKNIQQKAIPLGHPTEPVLCQDRRRLIFELKSILFDYELFRVRVDLLSQEMQARTMETLKHLYEIRGLFIELRRSGAISDSAQAATTRIRTIRLKTAWDVVTRVATSLTLDDYAWYTKVLIEQIKPWTVINDMRKAFTAHGPRRYSKTATDWAIATILLHFEFEEGNVQQVIWRLDKRMSRLSRFAMD